MRVYRASLHYHVLIKGIGKLVCKGYISQGLIIAKLTDPRTSNFHLKSC